MAAYMRRSIAARAKLIYEHQQRIAPCYKVDHRPFQQPCKIPNLWRPNFSTESFNRNPNRSTYSFQSPIRAFIPTNLGPDFRRNFSASSFTGKDVGDSLSDILVDTIEVAPVVNELVLATSDSSYQVAIFQTLMDNVHSYTGFSWWASIAITTISLRMLLIPLEINRQKIIKSNFVKKYGLALDKLAGANGANRSEGFVELRELHRKYGVHKLVTLFKVPLIAGSGYVCLFLAVWDMADKIPSFKHGGMLWFTDLSTPDSTYALPTLAIIVCFAKFKLYPQLLGGTDESNNVIKHVISALQIAWVATLPKAILCVWITSDLYTIFYRLVRRLLKQRSIKMTEVCCNTYSDNQDDSTLVKVYEDKFIIVCSNIDMKGEIFKLSYKDKTTGKKIIRTTPRVKNGVLTKEALEKVIAEWQVKREASK